MLRHLLPLLALLPLQGCCGLFGLFGCGLDTPLVPISWDSPDESLRTLLTAIKAGDKKVIYESLSEGFKAANGLDGLSLAVAWERLEEKVPGIHLAGDAEIVEETSSPGRRHYVLDAWGYRFAVDVAERPYWDLVRFDSDQKEPYRLGEYVQDLDEVLTAIDDEKGRVTITIQDMSLLDLSRDDVAFVKIGRAWKVRMFKRLED